MATGYGRYDPRFRNLVARTGDIESFLKYGVPAGTLLEWVLNGPREFFTLPEFELNSTELVQENLALKTKLDAIVAEQTLVAKTIKIFGFVIQYRRLPSAETKSEMIAEISAAAKTLPLERCLSVIGLSMARYRHWIKRQVHCLFEDTSSCPELLLPK